MKTEINLKLSPETWKYIRDEASRRQNSAAEIIAEILSEVIEDNYREPSKAEILEGIRIGMQQALTGETRSVESVS